MKTPLAWRNVAQSKVRSFVALCGVAFAILLIFMQLGFYAAARSSATNVYDALDFDLLVLSPHYVFVARPGQFPRNRLEEIRAVEGVESVAAIWIGLGEWRSVESRERWNILTLGVEPAQRPFKSEEVNDQLPSLKVLDTALSDSLSRPEHGPLWPGVVSEVQHHRVRIVGRYAIGAGFVAGATLLTGRDTFMRIFKEASSDRISAGLVKLRPGVSAANAAASMRNILSPDATAVTRAELAAAEQHFWLKVKPIGIMFTSGVLVAFAAGAVILYQVLASEVQNRLHEYATLKALGYGDRFVFGVVARQALIFCGVGFIPAFFLAIGLYFLLRTQALVPVSMEFTRAAGVFLLTGLMCLTATFLAVRKLRHADPADLF
ncbi:MAG: FtsX-like permease family protein [Chthoniobacterales bacterium]